MGIVTLILTVALTPAAMVLARKVGAIDYPEERRVHKWPTPRLGGVAMYISFFAAVFYFLPVTNQLIGLFLGATIIVAVGIYDDIKGMRPRYKLIGQIAAAVVLLFFGYQIKHVTLWFGVLQLGAWGGLLVVLWVVSISA